MPRQRVRRPIDPTAGDEADAGGGEEPNPSGGASIMRSREGRRRDRWNGPLGLQRVILSGSEESQKLV